MRLIKRLMMMLVAAVLVLPVFAADAPKVVLDGNRYINAKDRAEVVYVPAGEFTMGSRAGVGYSDEEPEHKVYLDGYWIYQTEVTMAQYRAFCQATSRSMPLTLPVDTVYLGFWKDDHPIVKVTWDDATAYAKWAGAALPTEAQWEKAARGTDGRSYPWGNEWDAAKCVNSVGSFRSSTAPVGSISAGASPYGALDMAGNVGEWCADWYDKAYYSSSPVKNPTGPASGKARVLRGGSWLNTNATYFRSADRYRLTPSSGDYYDGVRCIVLSPGL